MKRAIAFGLAAAGIGAGVARRLRAGAAGSKDGNRWLKVTVNCPPERLPLNAELPKPLARIQAIAELRTRPLPGDRGTELAARLREPAPAGAVARATGDDPRQEIRKALRETKSLVETGEVLQPDSPPSTRETPGGRLVGLATRRAGGEGRL